ncbi:amino acid ABC transporter substrate-binding protein (PAAT family) [Tamilnaduibacter salinus]|uniref:Amino acid ABC transporter substrate-binding protein (PAAT family) n=1 Tax=Tamilnaduibacter salinus TaxID=1484056 RepID=A0A2U1CX22_9GAMM|nr:transporter substrate-binding domain-containing protein [Tamilnaduibacter salinus]PVY76431.1 amino acid ABC transporter substrate-binding protein (PAAT family) [Tamilnaduibacter salinus]
MIRVRLATHIGVLVCLILLFPPAAWADIPCDQAYRVQPGDTLSRIAGRAYGDVRKWTVIYNNNIRTIGTNPHLIHIGTRLHIGCLNAAATSAPTPGWQAAEGKSIKVLTGGNYQPFTGKELPNGGLVTDVVNSALNNTPGVTSFGVAWVDDWSRHLDPLLSNRTYDLGFPWLKPDCRQTPDNTRCRHFLFSDPMFEMLVLLFVDRSGGFVFQDESDIHGKTLCRPDGYYTHDLEKNGRLWLTNNRVVLKQPDSVDACFRMLTTGSVDAVALNEFTGRSAMKRLNLENRVRIVQSRPLSIEGLHVLVHRDHPQAERLIGQVNDGLNAIKDSGRYQSIVDRHLSRFWEQF